MKIKKFTKLLLFVTLAIVIFNSCKKDKVYCWECPVRYNSNVYQDVGCMTEDEYRQINFTDTLGNDVDCRKK